MRERASGYVKPQEKDKQLRFTALWHHVYNIERCARRISP